MALQDDDTMVIVVLLFVGLTSPLGSILRVGGSETEFVTFCEKCSHQKHPLVGNKNYVIVTYFLSDLVSN